MLRWKEHAGKWTASKVNDLTHIRSVPFDDDSVGVSKIGRWHPSIGMRLPPLKALYLPRNAEDRLHMKKERRMEYCSFRAYSEGPTDYSCWVIPGDSTLLFFIV